MLQPIDAEAQVTAVAGGTFTVLCKKPTDCEQLQVPFLFQSAWCNAANVSVKQPRKRILTQHSKETRTLPTGLGCQHTHTRR